MFSSFSFIMRSIRCHGIKEIAVYPIVIDFSCKLILKSPVRMRLLYFSRVVMVIENSTKLITFSIKDLGGV